MAANDVFVDTAGFLALWDAADSQHEPALALQAKLAAERRRFLTTDYVVDETVTLLLHTAAGFFARHQDKEWSFVSVTRSSSGQRSHGCHSITL
jgi:predicted nucleic acid-binding protein